MDENDSQNLSCPAENLGIKVSVIIPAFNASEFVSVCLDSVIQQSYKNLEILLVDDGSTDRTLDIALSYQCRDSRIKVFSIDNSGAGFARNYALHQATGSLVMFLDSDDMLQPTAIKSIVERAQEDDSDMIAFSKTYVRSSKGYGRFKQVTAYFGKKILVGADRFLMLDTESYYSCTQCYKKDMLDKYNIRFAEGHLYEDASFFVKSILSSKKISVIYSPLAKLRVHTNTATRRDHDSDKHSRDYIKSISECVALLNTCEDPNISSARYYFCKYAVRRFIQYYYVRIPKQFRKSFTKNFLLALGQLDEPIPLLQGSKRMELLLRHKVFKRRRASLLRLMVFYLRKLRPTLTKMRTAIRSRFKFHPQNNLNAKVEIDRSIVLFMGFDYRYTGNSRYLFERISQEFPDRAKYYFVTDDPVEIAGRKVAPNTDEFNNLFAKAGVVIFETWIPKKLKKPTGAIWIQLWHGDLVKKMLFDADEHQIFEKNPQSKINHYADISRWNFFVSESHYLASFFQSAFLIPEERLIISQYPRVKYLIEARSDSNSRDRFAQMYSVEPNKKIVLYLPTWRDYNYGLKEEERDTSYFLDCLELQKKLGTEYEILCKDHVYLHKTNSSLPSLPLNSETQELLVLADFVITDYSSVIFDAASADIPVLLYCNDFDRFQDSRGTYKEIWEILEPLVCESVDDLAKSIMCYSYESTMDKVKTLAYDKTSSAYGIENTIFRFAHQRRVYSWTIFLCEDISSLLYGIKYFRGLFGKGNMSHCIIVAEKSSPINSEIKALADSLGYTPWFVDKWDLDYLFENFWIDRILVCGMEPPQSVRIQAKKNQSDLFCV